MAYCSFDGDGIGQKVGRLSLANDVEGVRRQAQAIDSGQALIRSWVLSCGGSVISQGGDEARVEVPASRLQELPDLRRQYGEAVGASCSVGVGMSMGEADKALLHAKLHGKDRISFFVPAMDEELERLEHAPKSEVEKLTDEYLSGALGKSEAALAKAGSSSMSMPALLQGGGGTGMTGPQRPQAPTLEPPGADAGAAGSGSASQRPPELSRTHAAADFEEQFHDLAQAQGQKDAKVKAQQDQEAAAAQQQDGLKARVAQVLKLVQKQAPVLEQIRKQAPDLYQVVTGCVQALILMAKELRGGAAEEQQPLGKAEEDEALRKAEEGDGEPLEKMAVIHDDPENPMEVYRFQDSRGRGPYAAVAMNGRQYAASRRRPGPRDDFDDADWGRLWNDGEMDRRFHFGFEKPEDALAWFGPRLMRNLQRQGFKLAVVPAQKVLRSQSGKQVVFLPTALKPDIFGDHVKLDPAIVREHVVMRGGGFRREPIEDPQRLLPLGGPAVSKGEPPPNATTPVSLHHIPPVGSQKRGKVKVEDPNTKTHWVSVRAGQILGQNDHAISSLNPGGR